MHIPFLKKKCVPHLVNGVEVNFYPVRVAHAEELQTIFTPIFQGIGDLFGSRSENDTDRTTRNNVVPHEGAAAAINETP